MLLSRLLFVAVPVVFVRVLVVAIVIVMGMFAGMFMVMSTRTFTSRSHCPLSPTSEM